MHCIILFMEPDLNWSPTNFVSGPDQNGSAPLHLNKLTGNNDCVDQVEISLPDLEGRTNIFKIHARSMSVEKVRFNLLMISHLSVGFSRQHRLQ